MENEEQKVGGEEAPVEETPAPEATPESAPETEAPAA